MPTLLLLLFILFIAIVCIQFIYYVLLFGVFSFSKKQDSPLKKIPVSVIVCAKNDENHIVDYVPLLAAQEYPDFEIILIDNASSDGTLDIFEEFEKKYSNVRLVKVENNEAFWGNRKFALTLGIKAAKKEYLLFTDADCYPKSNNWIAQMSAQFTLKKTVVLGYHSSEKIAGSFLNKIIRFENMLTATHYLSWAKLGKPFRGIGKNLAYKKEEFFKVNGFIDHMKIRSGDDELFINQVANSKNTMICISPDSFTYSKPKLSFKEWTDAIRVRAANSSYFKPLDKLQLRLFFISQLLFLLLPIFLLVTHYQWITVLSLIGVRYLFVGISLGFSAGKLHEKDVMYWFPVLEIILIFTQLKIYSVNSYSKPAHWK